MKRVLMVVLLAFIAVFAASCRLGHLDAIGNQPPVQTPVATPAPAPATITTPEPTPTPPVDVPNIPPATDMQRVGAEGFGFLYIPSNWGPFRDISISPAVAVNIMQFSDPTGSDIITLQYIDTSEDFMTPEDFINVTASFMEMTGGVDVEGARVNLNGIEALQVYGFFPAGETFMVTFAFEGGPDRLNQITVEGPMASIMDTMRHVESSFVMSLQGQDVAASVGQPAGMAGQIDPALIGTWDWFGLPYYVFEANGEGQIAPGTTLEQNIRWTASNGVLAVCVTPLFCGDTCTAPSEWYYTIAGDQLHLTSRLNPSISYTYTRQ